MIRIVTSSQMREMDRRTIEVLGIPGAVLMENAGRGTAMVIDELLAEKPDRDPLVYIFCGKGNNGGDGFVIGRLLWNSRVKVKTFIIAKESELKGDAELNFKIIKNMGLDFFFISTKEELNKHAGGQPTLIVDALLGTGITGAVYGFMKDVIEYINEFSSTVVSVDIPSGLNADSPAVEGVAVKADKTVTMALPKRCQLFHPAKNYVGQLMITDIGIPYSVEQDVNVDMLMIENSDIGMPERFQNIHKYQCGKVAVLAGSPGFTGAASLTSQAALSIGAGLVILGIPDGLNSIVENKLTEVITRPYHLQKTTQYLKSATDTEIESLLEWCDVLAMGPGLGRSEETQQAMIDILSRFNKAAVLDADALFALANKPEILDTSHPSWILTPHHGEFYRFLQGVSKDDFQKSYLSLAQKFAKEKGVVLLLKDAPSLVASPEGMIYVNSNGNPGLASGGTGDVLTGFVAGLMAQGLHPVEAAYTANFLHGACADEVAINKTEYALTATDLIENIGIVIKNMF